MAYNETPTKGKTMKNRVKQTKAFVEENKTVIALTIGVLAGVATTKLLPTPAADVLAIPNEIAIKHMRETGAALFYQTKNADFLLKVLPN